MSSGARAIVHLDMDAFYASVEQRDDPRLRGRPVIVGGNPRRGVVLAASYEVRRFGVRSAMPMAQALRLAPGALVVPPRFSAYAEASERVFEILSSATPLVEPLSLDEAFLDVTQSQRLRGAPGAIASKLREEIRERLQLNASAGIAPGKLVAKIASDLAKPNGQREVAADEVRAFLGPLPVSRLFGVGPKTEAALGRLGLRTVADVAGRDPAWLAARLGALGPQLHALAHGVDDRPVVPDRQQKSLGAEDTFAQDVVAPESLWPQLHDQALRVGRRLRRAGLVCRTVGLKLKLHDFRLLLRRRTLRGPTDDGQELYRVALELLSESSPTAPVRLCGVAALELSSAARSQRDLFAPAPERQGELNRALDRIAAKFGERAVTTADLLGRAATDDDEARRRAGGSRALDLSARGSA
ncbi:MAG: DNA polymerase IV [Deltaproteobacteria bacterium]